MQISNNGIPRRNRIDLYTPAELAIREAMLAIEEAGCHPLLTDAINLLSQAKEKVADHVETAKPFRLELNLVKVINKENGARRFYGVNDKHYDGMFAAGGIALEDKFDWDYLGDVVIEEQILNEQGFFYVEKV